MYVINNHGELFADEWTEWLLEAGFIKSKFQMSIYYNYSPDGFKIVDLHYFDDFVYWYTTESIEKWFV